MKQGKRLLLAMFAVSAIWLGCASGGSQEAAAPFVAPVADGVQRVTIVARSFAFAPARVVVKAGTLVELTLSKEPDVIPHNFTLNVPEAGLAVSETLGTKPKVVRFTPAKPGTYEFYCDENPPLLKSHRAMGMVGTLEVVP